MEQFSREDIKKYFSIANEYFKKRYPNGIDLVSLCKDENDALRLYLKFYNKNMQQGKIRYNSAIKKARIEWFILETIEKIMKINNLDKAENLEFCLNSTDSQISLFLDYITKEQYNSYILNDDLDR